MSTTLHFAARDGNVELVDEILEGKNGHVKVSINTQNASGQTAMHLAAKWGRLEVIKFLIEAGADLEIVDRKGRAPMHEAKDASREYDMLRHSTRLKTQMDVAHNRMLSETVDLKIARKAGELTREELEDAMERLEFAGYFDEKTGREEVTQNIQLENLHMTDLEEIEEYMRVRPEEIKNELFKVRHKIMRKQGKVDERQRVENKRMKDIADHEERRAEEKRREERHEVKELHRERNCGKCGQIYTNDKNRGGMCIHKGEWTNWVCAPDLTSNCLRLCIFGCMRLSLPVPRRSIVDCWFSA